MNEKSKILNFFECNFLHIFKSSFVNDEVTYIKTTLSKSNSIILSKRFINKGWTNYELDGIITKAVSGDQIVLPIWHNITKQEVIDYSPSLADKLARNTSSYTVNEIAEEISEVIQSA